MRDVLFSRFAATPVMVEPTSREWFEGCLSAVAGHQHAEEFLTSAASSAEDFWFPPDDWRAHYRPYVVKDGVLLIPVKGVLLNEFPWQLGSWATGYEYIWKAFERGMGDREVRGIGLVTNSPGGVVSGNFDLVDRMYALRDRKPVRAIVAEHAYSAAYSIASVAQRITVARTGGVGSIGVLTAHVDFSKALDEAGWKITLIFAGKHKVDGNPYEPLPAKVKARIQARVEATYSIFVSTVARNRGVGEDEVRATESLTYTAQEAVSSGWLADDVGALDDAVVAFAADLSQNEEDDTMSTKSEGGATAPDAAALATAVTNARAEGVAEGEKAGRVEGEKAGRTAGAADERARIKAIVESDEAKKRPASALKIALTTDLTTDQAKALLAGLPEEGAAGKTTPFEAAMQRDNPELGAGNGTGDEGALSDAERILANQRAFTGAKKST